MQEKRTELKLRHEFYSYPFRNSDSEVNVGKLAEGFSALMNLVDEVCLDPRYKAIAQTKLEEAGMFATKSITHFREKSERPEQ